MIRLLRCSNDHQWSDAPSLDGGTIHFSTDCPVCGAQGIAAKEETAQHGQTPELTAAPNLQLPSQTDIATLAPESAVLETSDRTVQSGPALAAFDDGPSTLPDSALAQVSRDSSTLPLSSSDLPSQDSTEFDEDAGDVSDHTRPMMENVSKTDNTLDPTEATAPPRPTDIGKHDGAATGKRGPVAATKATGKYRKDAKLPEKVAGYEILGLLGRGGMGVVYKARQAGLNRLCALKMILGGGLASADAIARFKIEAEAIAHLQHPNIVQVYEIGEENGSPYFSLEFVEGSNLQNKIASTPQPPAETARMMQQICEGVYAAHQRGVLHRDLKPANVLLTKDNVPKITDFGLAKRLEEEDHGQTRTGAIMGTPSYMAPEQAMGRAKELGPPADIYSLGAVLYDMLTGRPPFKGETVMDTLNQVQKLEPLPPRQLVPKVPRDLQTICLKALNKDPLKRYATAGEMGADLGRYLAGEPILARPTPLWERSAKWVKRRPATATLIGVSTLAFFSVLAFGGLWLNSERVAAKERETLQADAARAAKVNEAKERALHNEADKQRQRAEVSFDQAQDAVDKMLTRVGSINLEYEPRMEPVRKELLDEALKFNMAFLAQRGDEPAVRYNAAKAYENVGKINRMLAKYDEATKNYETALDRYRELSKEFAQEEYQRAVAKCTKELALVWQLQGKLQDSEKGCNLAKAEYDKLATAHPEDLEYQVELANLQYSLGGLCMSQQRLQDAEAHYDAALNVRTVLMAKGFDTPAAQHGLAGLQLNRGILLYQIGKKATSEKSLVGARDTLAALSKKLPQIPDYPTDWAYSCINLGICYRLSGRMQLADDSLHDAVNALKKLQTSFPSTPIYRQKLAHAITELGILEDAKGQLAPAADEFTKAIDLLEPLHRDQPNLAAVRLQLAKTHTNLGIALVRSKKAKEGLKHYQIAVDLLEALKPVAAASPDICAELAVEHFALAEVLAAYKDTTAADKSRQRMITLQEELVAAFPQSTTFRSNLAESQVDFSQRFLKFDKSADAVKYARAAASQMQAALALQPKDASLRQQLFSTQMALAKSLLANKDHAASAVAATDASSIFPKDAPNGARRELLIAGIYGQCMAMADKDQALDMVERKTKVNDYGDKALASLKEAINLGFNDVMYLYGAPDFELLRQRPEFQELVRKLEKNLDL